MIAYAAPVPGFNLGKFEPHPAGNGLVIVRKLNGKLLCVTPDGDIEERDSPGPWEGFRKGRTTLIAERDGGRVFILPYVE
jgi:hypothetical protein